MKTVNLGILAHVDAGKTSLTERLLYTAGVIDEIGRVDDGSTQTDTLAIERQRGITIKSAVVSFVVDDVTVNLIDTPGHPDFIAEVERVLSVLDGIVLVVSAVEGVQAQTRILMRALRRLGLPTLIFVNKIDRVGADAERVLLEIAGTLTPAVISMGSVRDSGTRDAGFTPYCEVDSQFLARLADLLSHHDDALLATYVDDEAATSYSRLRSELVAQTRHAQVSPVFFGSAITGAGTETLMAGITELLPAVEGDAEGPVSGIVFKIERGPAAEKIAYVRLFSGRIRTRDLLHFQQGSAQKITAINVFERGTSIQSASLVAGQIGKLRGLGDVKIGDSIGAALAHQERHYFAPPTLETVVVPRRRSDNVPLHRALKQLAEQDPLIDLRQDDMRQEMFVSLYGEVQKEVIQSTLANDFAIHVDFRETTPICIERPIGTGAAAEIIFTPSNPFVATVGLRIEPALLGTGAEFRLEVELGSIPLSFHKAVEETVRETLHQGLHGWQVIDYTVTMTHSGYSSVESTAGDFRKLTPLVLMAALKQAGTVVCEPMHCFRLDIPTDTLGALMPVLARLRANLHAHEQQRASYQMRGTIPAARVHELQQELPALTRGEGVLESAFDHYKRVSGSGPSRPRTDHNPLNRKEYLLHVTRRV